MKNIRIKSVLLALILALFVTGQPVSAATPESTRDALLVQIIELLNQQITLLKIELAKQQANMPVVENNQEQKVFAGDAKIDISEPFNGINFDAAEDEEVESFTLRYEAESVPENTALMLVIKNTQLYSGYYGGGKRLIEIESGQSEGEVSILYGYRQGDPGEYLVRLELLSCPTAGCNNDSVYLNEAEEWPLLAKSGWLRFSIGDLDDDIYIKRGEENIYDIEVEQDNIALESTVTLEFRVEGVDESEDKLMCVAMRSDGNADGAQLIRMVMNVEEIEEAKEDDEEEPFEVVCLPAENGYTDMRAYFNSDYFERGLYRPVVWITPDDEDSRQGYDLTFDVKRSGKWVTVE